MWRRYFDDLDRWKGGTERRPLILLGARQVGKSTLIEKWGERSYQRLHTFDFEKDPRLSEVFERDLKPTRIIEELRTYQRLQGLADIDVKTDLIFFDEVQECPRCLTALRYFYEEKSDVHVIAAGSLLGVKFSGSFPVGRVDEMKIYPMTFREYLAALPNKSYLELFENMDRSLLAFDALWSEFCKYLYVGGMPMAVRSWVNEEDPIRAQKKVREIQSNILSHYQKDFVKHAGKVNANHINYVFENIPRQLANVMDDSVKRFKFKGVLPGQSKFTQLSGPLGWLRGAGLSLSAFQIEGHFEIPLNAFAKENLFKLFLFDTGLLGSMLDLPYESQVSQKYGIVKGYFAENYVAQALVSQGYPLFSWKGGKSEVEFVIRHEDGFVPIEVKSGKRTKAKSLGVFVDKFSPKKSIKFVGSAGAGGSSNMVLPLYFAERLKDILDPAGVS